MGGVKVSTRILQGIRENSEGEKAIEDFLVSLMYEEAGHPGQWWWKEVYRRRVDQYSADWEETDED